MVDFLKPILSRVIASWIAALAIYLSAHFNVVLDETTKAQLAAGFLAVIFGIGSTVYAIFHRLVDKRLNPVDAASGSTAAVVNSAVTAPATTIPQAAQKAP